MRPSPLCAFAGERPGQAHARVQPGALSPRLIAYCLLSIAFCLHPLPLRAEVFWRLPKTSDAVLKQLGGTRVYATDVLVNGTPGSLCAYAFDQPVARTSADLSRGFGLPKPAAPGAALLTHAEKEHLYRLLVLPSPGGGDSSVVLAFDQPLSSAARAGQAPADWPAGCPALNATPVFSAVCATTHTTFVSAESASSPESAVQEAVQTLVGAGWGETTPGTDTFRIFVSGKKQCVVLATRNQQTGRTAISLLQREGATP